MEVPVGFTDEENRYHAKCKIYYAKYLEFTKGVCYTVYILRRINSRILRELWSLHRMAVCLLSGAIRNDIKRR